MAGLLTLSATQIEAFFEASRDANPLHRDVGYARRTPFGRPVAYGMAAVLRVLALGAAPSRQRLISLRCTFRKPLFVDTGYELIESVAGPQRRFRIGRGGIDYLVIHAQTQDWDGHASGGLATGAGREPASAPRGEPDTFFVPRADASPQPICTARSAGFEVRPDALAHLLETFDLSTGQFPAQQIATLLWMSYHVGMEMPGRQALFAEARVEFAEPTSPRAELRLDLEEASFDSRFNRYTLEARGPGIRQLTLSAFRRPEPVMPALEKLKPTEVESAALRGKKVLVTGAARGFGAEMTLACLQAGATVIAHHRGDPAEMQALARFARELDCGFDSVSADLEDPVAAHRLGAEAARLGPVDLVICNASPSIPEARLTEQTDEELLAFTRRNLVISLACARHLLPQLNRGGQFVHISTAYLSAPVPGFPHYLAAKAAQEGLTQALSQEYRDIRFVIARLPRMRTDQTNAPFSVSPLASPADLARELVQTLIETQPQDLRLIELAGPRPATAGRPA